MSPSLVLRCPPMILATGLKTSPPFIGDSTMRYHLFDSRARLAAAVFVTLACYGIVSNAQSVEDESDKTIVNVDIYYEALCSDSMYWIVNQLVPSYPQLKDHLHVTLIPYGKATHTRESETGPWQFTCQHGPAECRGNKAQACAIHAIQTSEAVQDHQELMVKLVGCAMSARNPPTAIPKCAENVHLSEETRNLINDCIANPFGDDLLAKYGDKTKALEPKLKFVPTVVVNKVYSDENQNAAQSNFSNLICQHLKATEKSSICGNEN